ncbi:hypothetical protein ACFVU2_18750 [Leifsonia sp. NPDC058194]|uniref:hypothetical protein n=1 Tax=Leifsonia sp. NPDC058194 TaxID=3346374 RepID=UPI0036DBADA1
MTRVSFDAVWTGDGVRPTPAYRVDGDRLTPADADREQRTEPEQHAEPEPLHLGGTLFPRLTDHHVHLGLVDPVALFAGGITHAVDLGWDPAIARMWLAEHPRRPRTAIAGALLTAPGGYPVRSRWAPPAAAREIGGPRDGRQAVREQVMAGASRIKVALNSDAGETVDDATLRAIVDEAVHAGLPVVVHAQGAGQVERAVRAGVAQLAHAPFSERVPDHVVLEAAQRGMGWISTLDIHGWGAPTPDHDTAVDNLRRFHAAGGRVLYGTDLGNGPLPLGVNARELAGLLSADLDATAVLRAIAGGPEDDDLAAEAPIGPRIAWTPSVPPPDYADLPAWLATARGLRVADLRARSSPTMPTPTPTPSTEGPLP